MKHLTIAIFFIFWTCAYPIMLNTMFESSSIAVKTKHEQWMKDFGRTYEDDDEKEKRFKIFAEKLEYIEKFNRDGNETYQLGLNQFSDLTDEEFVESHSCVTFENALLESSIFNTSEISTTDSIGHKRKRPPPSQPSPKPKRNKIPDSVDWRQERAVTIVKNQNVKQKQCGSCWAFATTAVVEAITKIKFPRTPLTALSMQELIDCDEANRGCNGGSVTNGINYIAKNGIATLIDYPYRAEKDICLNKRKRRAFTKIKGYAIVRPGEQNLLEAVAQQPVAIGIATNENFAQYSGGIFGSGPCGPKEKLAFDHAVTVIGYGETGQDKYWLIKNSYGNSWGENGYMRLKRQGNSPYPVCGIAFKAAFYPIVVE